MTIIVTGAAGFIGSNVAKRFLDNGATVVGIDNLSRRGSAANLAWLQSLGKAFIFRHADVRNAYEIDRLFRGYTGAGVVFHEAAQVAVTSSVIDPRTDFEVNALGTFNVLESMRAHIPDAMLIFASTNKVYGGMEDLRIVLKDGRYAYRDLVSGVPETQPIDLHSPYGCSKGAADQYVRDYGRVFGLRTVVFRQSCIYGSRQFGMEDQGWVAWFVIASTLHRPMTVFGDGMQVRDLLWVDDLIDLYEAAIARPDVSVAKIYNAGGGLENTLSIIELLDLLRLRCRRDIQPSFAEWRVGDQRVFIADCRKAERELGWKPIISPERGIELLSEWVSKHRDLLKQVLG